MGESPSPANELHKLAMGTTKSLSLIAGVFSLFFVNLGVNHGSY